MLISQRSSGSAAVCSMMLGVMLFASGQNAAHAQFFKKLTQKSAQEFKKDTLVVNLQAQIGTANSKKGDTFTALVLQPSELAGSIVEGTVAKVMPAAAGGDKSHIVVQFSTITLPDNTTYRLQANFKDVVNSKGVARVDDEGQVVGTGNGKKAGAGTPASGLAFSQIGPTLGGVAANGVASQAISLDLAAPGSNVSFAPGTRFVLDAENAGQDKSVNAYRVRQEAATEAARAQTTPDSSAAPAVPHAAAATAPEESSMAAVPGGPASGNPLQRR
jgi:hypothetical protein